MEAADHQQRSSWGVNAASAGYSSLGPSITEPERSAIAKLAAQALKDPLTQSKLCDRIYKLMRDDLQSQRERQQNYGGQR